MRHAFRSTPRPLDSATATATAAPGPAARGSAGGAGTRAALLAAGALAAALAPAQPARAQAAAPDPTPAELAALHWRHVGPVGNRVAAVTGVPGDPNVYYFGAASGGVWKSRDGGHSWRPVFDDQPVQSIGAIALAPSDPDVVWVGTGEPFIRSNVSHGNGVYRSTDGGESWTHLGLAESGRIGRIVVHPQDPDVAWVAALGHLYGPQEQRGVFRTTDGGATWERVLFVDEDTGAADLAMAPDDPDVLYAGMWTMLIRPWGRWSGGPGDGLYRSRDGGDTWERLVGNGLPTGTTGKIGLATTPADPDRVYALIETNVNREHAPVGEHEGVLWRSDDRGDTWRLVSSDHTLVQRPHYYSRAAAAPDDADEIHFMATRHSVSTDGGASIRIVGGGDNHDIWIDPLLPDRRIVGNDQGVKITTNRGADWYRPLLPIAQMYHVAVDTRVPYHVYGNRQDGAAVGGPSRVLYGGGIPVGEWRSVGGCESGWALPDTVSNDVVWSGCYEGILDRTVLSTGHARRVSVWPDNPEGWEAAPLRYRFQWTFPVHLSPHDPSRVYVGSQHVHRTTDGGQSWQVISPDLTLDDEEKQRRSGGLTPDDVSPTYYSVLFAIAESPVEEGVIWAGSNDGRVHVTRDGGGRWTDVTGAIPGLEGLGTISNVEPSPHRAGAAYLTVDRHQLGDFEPYVYATEDYGASWRRIDGGLPRGPLAFAHVVREDPERPRLLYVGTHSGLHASWDDGRSWTSLATDLPPAPVSWVTVQTAFDDLVISTYGRGFWILDDISPLRQLDDAVTSARVHLFDPRPAYRFLGVEGPNSQPGDPAEGENARYGAALSFWAGADAAGREAELTVLDAAGRTVRSLRTEAVPGLNRVWWNLRDEASPVPRIRTDPLEHAHAGLDGAEFRGPPEGGRLSILVPPGTYTVRLSLAGEVRESRVEVLRDPASEGTRADLEAQVAFLRDVRRELEGVVALTDDLEWKRKRLSDLRLQLSNEDASDPLLHAVREAEAALEAIEMEIYDLRLTGGTAGQDALRWPRRLYAKLLSLAGYASGTDHRPTDAMLEILELYRERHRALAARARAVDQGLLAELNRRLEARGLPAVTGGPG